MNQDDNDNENEEKNAEKEPQITSSDPNERKLARQLRIERRLEAIRRANMTEGEDEEEMIEKTLLQEQLQKSYEFLEKLTSETLDCATNVKVANESREINRRELEGINKVKILESLQDGAQVAEEHFGDIDGKWARIFDYNDPLLINEEIMKQKEKCNALIKHKDEIIAHLKNEVTIAEMKYSEDQQKQMEDIQTLTDRIEKQLVLMRRAYNQELEVIEDVMMVERKNLIESTDKRWEDLHKKRDAEEQANCDRKFEQQEEFEAICAKLRIDHQEKHRDIKIKLGNNIEELQCELELIKSTSLLNSEKLDYNYQVLKKREAENIIIKSQQKRRINKLQDTINDLRAKTRNYSEKTNEQIDKLSLDIKKLRNNIFDVEAKADDYCKRNDVKYRQVWDFNKKRATSLLRQIFNTDRILYEQQLGVKWTSPDVALMEKCELPSYQSALMTGVSDVCEKSEVMSKDTEVECDRVPDGSDVSSEAGETMAHRRILKLILKLIADKSGFLIEDKLREVLKPYAEEEKALVRIDSVFSALEIKNKEDIEILLDYFLPYTHCPVCMQSSSGNISTSETVIKTYDLLNESQDTTEIQIDTGTSNILSAVHQPQAVIEEIVSNVTQIGTDMYSSSYNLQKKLDSDKLFKKPIEIKSNKMKSIAARTSCHKKHALVISSVYILRALREFLSKFYIIKDRIVTMSSRLARTRNTVSRLMADEDVKMYWDRYRNAFSSDKEEIWNALYIGLQKYNAILVDKRSKSEKIKLTYNNTGRLVADKQEKKIYLMNASKSRVRGSSTGSIEEFLKRKRTETQAEKQTEEENLKEVFKKSKVTQRSPIKITNPKITNGNQREMDNEMREEFKNEITKLREEVKDLKQEMSQKEKQWDEERKMLKERILDIEESMEKKDREARKNDIVIKNVECKEEELKQHLEQVLESHIGVKDISPELSIEIIDLPKSSTIYSSCQLSKSSGGDKNPATCSRLCRSTTTLVAASFAGKCALNVNLYANIANAGLPSRIT
ncbi:hypothetical protein FQR65_LT01756 [Abscondita terminalis]|nr:hypothetical protein FQR65_LT01756 [Abscondita terminalis]